MRSSGHDARCRRREGTRKTSSPSGRPSTRPSSRRLPGLAPTTRTPASSVATTSTPLLLFFLLSCKYKTTFQMQQPGRKKESDEDVASMDVRFISVYINRRPASTNRSAQQIQAYSSRLVLGEDGHVGAELREVLLLPQGRDRLGLRVEVHASLCATRSPQTHTRPRQRTRHYARHDTAHEKRGKRRRSVCDVCTLP